MNKNLFTLVIQESTLFFLTFTQKGLKNKLFSFKLN